MKIPSCVYILVSVALRKIVLLYLKPIWTTLALLRSELCLDCSALLGNRDTNTGVEEGNRAQVSGKKKSKTLWEGEKI